MSDFTGDLTIKEIVSGKKWRLVDPIIYEAGEKGSHLYIVVPAGFETDGASIPSFLKIFLAVWGSYGRAACLHDYLYAQIRDGKPHKYAPTRKDADREFYIAMRACGTHKPLARMLWLAVRIFGGRYATR